jgi:hypothetical protein
MLIGFNLAFCVLTLAQANSHPSVEKVEMEALAHRRAIVRGFVTFQRKSLWIDGDTVRVWFDGKKVRQDWLHKGNNGSPLRRVDCVGCECDDCEFLYQQSSPGAPVMGVRLDKKNTVLRSMPVVVVDPKRVGFVPFSLFGTWRNTLDIFVGRPERQNSAVSKTTFNGQDCSLVEYTGLHGERVKIWIAPGLGYNVTRLAIAGIAPQDGVPWKTILESKIAQWGSKKVWYPSSYVFERARGGKIQEKEEVIVTRASLNEPIDPKVFTLAGLDLLEGIAISGSAVKQAPPGKENVWLKGQIRQLTVQGSPARPPAPQAREPQRLRGWLVIVSVLAAGIAAIAGWRLFATKTPCGEA